jgi:preprotein translocase subunit SecE
MQAYKPDQGRMARMATFWSLVLLLLFGCSFLHETLTAYVPSLKQPLGGFVIPIVSVPFSGSFAISGLLFLGGLAWLYVWTQKPKVADFLIEVEAELKKVTWPTMQEVVNASIVVVICVAVLMGFLAGGDFVLGRLVERLIFGWGS